MVWCSLLAFFYFYVADVAAVRHHLAFFKVCDHSSASGFQEDTVTTPTNSSLFSGDSFSWYFLWCLWDSALQKHLFHLFYEVIRFCSGVRSPWEKPLQAGKACPPVPLQGVEGWGCVCVWDLGVNYYRNRVLEQKCVGHSVASAPIFCAEHKEHGVGWVHNHLKTRLNWLCSVFQQELPLSRNQAWRAQAHMEVICCRYDDLRFEKRGISLSISFHTS